MLCGAAGARADDGDMADEEAGRVAGRVPNRHLSAQLRRLGYDALPHTDV